jgi:hypothetical protein
MKQRFSYCLIAIAAALLVSCASGVPFTQLNPSLNPEIPNSGRIFFYRVTGLGGAAIQPDILMNGEKIGKSIPQGFFYLDRPAGKYTVVTSTEVKRKVSFVLDEGQTRYIRFNISMGFFAGHVYGELVDPVEAEKEIQECKYTPLEEKKS